MKNKRRRISDTAYVAPILSSSESMDESDNLESKVEFLRRENRRLTTLAAKQKHVKDEQVDAIYQAAFDAFSRLDLSPVKSPTTKGKGKDSLISSPALSDFQVGKVTDSYNSDICRERIDLFADKVIEATDIYRSDYLVDTAHVHILGDIVEGERIFPGQAFEIHESLYQQILDGVEMTVDYLRRMLSCYKKVHVAAVIGNHGWLGRRGEYNPESNMDRLLYKFVSMLMANEPRITFDIPEGYGESRFFTVDKMGNYSTLLIHGDQMGQPTSTHSYQRKVLSWKDGGITEYFDDVRMGHYHQSMKFRVGGTVVRITGTPESDNTYAQERLGVRGEPSQHLMFVNPDQGIVVAEHDVILR